MLEQNKYIRNEILTNNGVKEVSFIHNKLKIIFDNNENTMECIWKYEKNYKECLKNDISLNIFGRTKNGTYVIVNNVYYVKENDLDNILHNNTIVFTLMPEKYVELL